MTEATKQDSQLSADERADVRRMGWTNFVTRNRRLGHRWEILDRYSLVIATPSSDVAHRSLVFHLLADLFPSTSWRAKALLTPEVLASDLDLALDHLGPDIKHVRVHTPNGGQAGLRVAATSRLAALDHIRSLGTEPLVG